MGKRVRYKSMNEVIEWYLNRQRYMPLRPTCG